MWRPTNAPVLFTGETGVGKEMIARELHRLSMVSGPFIPVNRAGVPRELLESGLFGPKRGAFTGAQARRRGFVELADGGTLFLDEVDDWNPPDLDLPSRPPPRRLRLEDERDRILRALEAERWIVARAARDLGVPRHWLRDRIRKHGLEPPEPEGAGT